MIFSFWLMYLITDYYGVSFLGEYGFYLSVGAILHVVLDFGSTLRILTVDSNSKETSRLLFIATFVKFLAAASFAAIGFWFESDWLYVLVYSLFIGHSEVAMNYLKASQKYFLEFSLNLFYLVVLAVVTTYLHQLEKVDFALFLIVLICSRLFVIVLSFVLSGVFRELPKRIFCFGNLKKSKILNYYLDACINSAVLNLDVVLLRTLVSPEQLGIYVILRRVYMVAVNFLTSLETYILPHFLRIKNRDAFFRKNKHLMFVVGVTALSAVILGAVLARIIFLEKLPENYYLIAATFGSMAFLRCLISFISVGVVLEQIIVRARMNIVLGLSALMSAMVLYLYGNELPDSSIILIYLWFGISTWLVQGFVYYRCFPR